MTELCITARAHTHACTRTEIGISSANCSRRLVHGDEVGGDHRGRLGEGSGDLLACFFFLQCPVNLIQIKCTLNVIISNRKFWGFFTAKECLRCHMSLWRLVCGVEIRRKQTSGSSGEDRQTSHQ